MKLQVVHSTRYRYSGPVAESVMELRLRPMDGAGQRCVDFTLELSSGLKPRGYMDGYGNQVNYLNLSRPHTGLSIVSRSVVETGLDGDLDPGEDLVQDFLRFRPPVTEVEGVREIARLHPVSDPRSPDAIETALESLTRHINREFEYNRLATNVRSTVGEVLELRAGVCQDFAHLLVAVARSMGVPARYVSGYIHEPRERGQAASSHAWAEAWVPGKGWIGYDATRPARTTVHHVRLAVGRDYGDAAPTRGVYVGSATGSMQVRVRTRELQ
jgi:transglutaminase-like putative cysteine protease